MTTLVLSLPLIFTFLATVRGQSSIVSTNTITPGVQFSVYCDASRAPPPQGVYSVQALSIYRNLTATNNDVLIAQYVSTPAPGLKPSVTNIPSGRNWTFTFSGDGGGASGNIATMKIVWDVNDASCNDAGIYRCQIDYFLNNGASTSAVTPGQTVTAIAGLSSFGLTVDPVLKEYSVFDNITLICSSFGPASGVNFQWELWVNNQPQSLPANNKIVNKPPTPQTGNAGCVQYTWVSTLKIQVPADYKQQTYRCIVTYLQQQESGNLTIDVTSMRALPSIVSTNTIHSGRKFSVYCDASRSTIPQDVSNVVGLLMYRNVTADNNFSLIAEYYSYFGPPSGIIPSRRNWSFTFSGANNGVNNTATMKIVLDVNDAMCSDAGIYRCVINYGLQSGASSSVQAPDQNVRATSNLPSAVSINTVPEGGAFTVYCDASRANPPDESIRSIQALTIYLSDANFLIAHYNSVNPPFFNGNVKTVPFDKDWNITFSGDNHGSNNIASMKIVLNVNHATYQDDGRYQCQIAYYLTAGGITTVQSPEQEVAVTSDGQASIVSTNSVTSGGALLVYCNSSRTTVTWGIYSVQALSIYRQTEIDGNYDLIAYYNSVNPDFNADAKNIPSGRNRNIIFSGDNEGSNNTATMKIVWEINDVMFSDAGMYRCQIGYYLQDGGLTSVQAPDQNVTVSGFCSP